MTTEAAGPGRGPTSGPAAGPSAGPSPEDRRAERARRRAAAAARRTAWYGDRWWAPGVVVAVLTAVVGWGTTEAWLGFEARGCFEPGAKFACLGEALLGAAAAVVLGPLLLWLAYRAAGVRRPLLSVVVAAAVASCLLAAPELLSQVLAVTGVHAPLEPWLAVGVGAVLGVAALGGGLALQGPARGTRAGLAGLALGALVVSVLLMDDAAGRARTRLDLQGAAVPLLLPDASWRPYSAYVGTDGVLTYTAVPAGPAGSDDPPDGPRVEVSADLSRFGDSCGYRACVDDGDIRTEVAETGDAYGIRAWRVVDGALVTMSTGRYGPPVDIVPFLRGTRAVTVEEFVDRQYPE